MTPSGSINRLWNTTTPFSTISELMVSLYRKQPCSVPSSPEKWGSNSPHTPTSFQHQPTQQHETSAQPESQEQEATQHTSHTMKS
ncbi:unnamed protein product [Ambrosiozyma monospora]|uniref:Unnamed protein product n=1 Tax=Ambrosiozyma monospora TaxID=43982 RepID=A0ACB5SXH6_AMBMO|nr:unnamed protein product [Ambrosiozyma monospora]